MNEETIAFPQYVDNYAPMMFWEADDLIPFIIGLEGGNLASIVIDHRIVQLGGIVIGIYAARKYAQSKQNNLSGMIFHMLYNIGIIPLNKIFKYGLMRRWNH